MRNFLKESRDFILQLVACVAAYTIGPCAILVYYIIPFCESHEAYLRKTELGNYILFGATYPILLFPFVMFLCYLVVFLIEYMTGKYFKYFHVFGTGS